MMNRGGEHIWQDWYRQKEFSTDWTSNNLSIWIDLLGRFRQRPVKLLEIGSWEGRSAIFFLEFLQHSILTCVDTFTGGSEHISNAGYSIELDKIEGRFDANLKDYGGRVRKIKSTSALALSRLMAQNESFDLIYIDGSHKRDDVMIDSLLSWKLLNDGGVMIWDDYGGGDVDWPAEQLVSPAVDTFLSWNAGELREIHRGYQLAIEKISSKPD
jgi:Methyltransferase domain